MPKAYEEWRVLAHGPIEKLDSNLWCVTGTLEGMGLERVMSIVRLDDGRLVIHSAVALEDSAMAEIEEWGTPSILLVPNRFHRVDALAYKKRYPELEVLCPRGARKGVEDVLPVDGDYSAFPESPSLRLETLDGLAEGEGVAIVSSQGGTSLIFTDAIFNMPHATGVAGFLLRYVTQSTGGPRVSRLFRMLALKDKKAFRAHLERLADVPNLARVVVAHHEPIVERPAEVLREVAGRL